MQLSNNSISTRALAALLAIANLLVHCSASSLRQAGKVARVDAEAALASELGEGRGEGRLIDLEASLKNTFVAFPKDSEGRLGHVGVRYILHRLFVQRHGWYIKGLDPGSDSTNASSQEEWVPSFLQERLETALAGRGASLRDLAVLAAAIEDLVKQEAVGRLKAVYEMHELSMNASLSQEQANHIISTFYVGFLEEGEFSASSPSQAERRKRFFIGEYAGWSEARQWLEDLVASAGPISQNASVDYQTIESIAMDIGEQYHKFNDLECSNLKAEMHGMESKKAGRVRLPEFYKKGLFSHWQFNEKIDYLRTLGAADETEPNNPLVILPNYLTARTNCLEASGIYALCCRNECEDLMGQLEGSTAAPEASPEKIAQLVATMATDTVKAPRELSPVLLERLSQVAATNGGKVPLYSRLFAQWMHHAFPRECPYPHEQGTTSPQTPDEWTRSSGQDAVGLSRDELQQQVEADSCAWVPGDEGAGAGCGEATGLPWSESEELLAGTYANAAETVEVPEQQQQPALVTNSDLVGFTSLSLWVILAVAHLWKYQESTRGILDEEPLRAMDATRRAACRAVHRERAQIAAVALCLAGHAADALDGSVVLFGAGVWLLRLAASRAADRMRPQSKVFKCCE